MHKKSYLSCASILALALALPVKSAAQESNASAEAVGGDETVEATAGSGDIVVTAQKRAERLVDVPVTVTAVSSDLLRDRQINDTRALVEAVPSLTYTEGGKASSSTFRIRGIGTSLFNFGAESSVSTVVDGVVLGSGAQGFAELPDVERIEVLEGPLGTLFGKNATAGAVNIVTARPGDRLSINGQATIAEGDEYRIKGAVSGPLTDKLGVGVAGYYSYVGGNLFSSVIPGKRIGTVESWGARGKVEWQPTETLNLLLTGSHYKTNSDCCGGLRGGVILRFDNAIQRQALIVPFEASQDNRLVQIYDPIYDNSHQTIVSLEANLELGDMTLTSISAYQDYAFNSDFPAVPDPSPPLYVAAVPQIVTPFGSSTTTTVIGANGRSKTLNAGGPGYVTQYSQELRLTSPSFGRFTYVAGLYFQTQEILRDYLQRWGSCPVTPGNTVGLPCGTATTVLPSYTSNVSNNGLSVDQIAVFGQGEYKITDQLTAIAGFRLQREHTNYFVSRPGAAFAGDVSTLTIGKGEGGVSDDNLSGKVGLQYHVSRNAQFYATYSRGYKGASYDIELTAPFAQAPVLPETVDAFEAGFKGSIFDGKVLLTAAAFYADYKNLQVQATAVDPLTFVTTFIPTNAGSTKTKGAQFAISGEIAEGLTFNTSVIYTHARVDANGLPCTFPQTRAALYGLPAIQTIPVGGTQPDNVCINLRNANGGVGSNFQNIRGGRLPSTPAWRGTASLRYEHPVSSSLGVFAQASTNFQSGVSFDLSQDPYLSVPGYTTIDLNFGVRELDDRWSVLFFVKNLTDKINYQGVNYSGNDVRPANYVLVYDQQGRMARLPKGADRYVGATLSFKL